jgi:nitrogen regulatory protein P-II 1
MEAGMKEIKAVVGPKKLDALEAALRAMPGFPGMTVSKAERYGAPSPQGKTTIRQELTDHVVRWRVEIVVPDELAGALYDAVVASLSSGVPGDSLVWLVDVERASFVHKGA